jgi:hypothetical protein
MKHFHSLRLAVIISITVLAISCKSDSEKPILEKDTRILVQQAYAKIDPMKITATFNTERAAILKSKLDQAQDPQLYLDLATEYASELLKTGQTADAIASFQNIIDYIKQNNVESDSASKRNLLSWLAISYMRQGEIENCVQHHNHSSCFIPIKNEGIHSLPSGSRNAIVQFEKILKDSPGDLETKYLLNIAYMTLGEYPKNVPAQYRIDPSWFTSKIKMKPFKDIAPEIGLNRNGHAGGVIMDDFTNDGWLDIVVTSWSPKEELIFYKNNGDGTFSDQTEAYGLKGQVGILNLNQTDFNNDGWLDLYLMRGAWYQMQGAIPNTLLMNTGKGSFQDITIDAGLTHFAPTQTSAWTDINLDGWLDLVVANESSADFDQGVDVYINQKNGKFTFETKEYGLIMNHYFKGCVATDVNNDKYPDLYFSSLNEGTFLFINQAGVNGHKGFVQTGSSSNIGEPKRCFPSWSFDFDNDGNEDLITSAFINNKAPVEHWMLSHMGKADPGFFPKVYHNKGNLIFEEVGISMGLIEVAFTMGCNYGDINTDGYLDFYMATGNPMYQSLIPNKMYLNMEGKRFEDVSYSGGFANIQKGHGVSFGDLDHDGDEDIYVVIGGSFDGDAFYNCLFENPNEKNNNWVILKLNGKSANNAAIGARVCLSIQEDGKERKIYRAVSSGASFGANSLTLEVGLRKATIINNVTVRWPCEDCPDQVFAGLEMNKAYHLIQDQSTPEPMEYNKVIFKEKEEGAMHMNMKMNH